MSGRMTAVDIVKKASSNHSCDWCGERINAGETYRRYRWFQRGDAGTCRMHQECYTAMCEAADDDGGWIEFIPGDNERPGQEYAQQEK